MPTTLQWEIQNSMFGMPVECFLRLLRPKTWFKLSRVKLYRNERGKKNYFELAGGSSYRG